MRKDIPKDVFILLVDIYEWIYDNDYECGPVGAELVKKIEKVISETETKYE